jgi:PAS domain S-box-containing protein
MYIIFRRKGTFQLMIIMILVCFLVTGISILIVYHVVIQEKKEYLKELSEIQTGIIHSIYAKGKNADEVILFLKQQRKLNVSLGKTGEFVIGYLKNDSIFFLLDHLRYDFSNPRPVPLKLKLAEPMKFALSEKTGFMRGLDYSNDKVLAYCWYIPELKWGIVTKTDISEVNEPFHKAGLYSGLISVLLVTIATLVFKRFSDPITKKIIEDEEKIRAILDATQESIYLFDRQGKLQTANRIGVKRLNVSEADILGRRMSDVLSPDLASSRQKHLDRVFATGQPERFEDIRDGYYFEHHFFPCFNDNQVNYVATYSRDVTDIRKKERQLLKLNRILKALEKSTKSMLKATDEASYMEEVCRIIVDDCDFIMVWIGFIRNSDPEIIEPVAFAGLEKGHPDTLKMTGAYGVLDQSSAGQAIRSGKPLISNNLDTDPAFASWRAEANKRGIASFLVLPLLDKGVAFGAIAIYSGETDSFAQQEVSFLTELASDLSYGIVYLRLKIAQTRAEEALKESEEKLKLALESGSIGVWVWDIPASTIEWDERMERIFGIETGSFGRTYAAFESCLIDEDIPHTRKAIKKALEEDFPLQTVYRIKFGKTDVKYISAKGHVTKDAKGIPVRMTGVCYDITEMKRDTEQLLFTLNEELLRSNKELEQFAYVASHDLQEPLRMVSSFTQLLAQRYGDKLDQDAKEFIQFAVDGASHMQALINDLLAYSRIQTRGKGFSDVDMQDALTKAVYNLGVKIQEKNALVTHDELPVVSADEGQMIQLFQNLIGNAIKFSGKSPIVHISAREEINHLIFSVKDNGIGIEQQYFERIFQIFQKLHPKDEYEGNGIGLAICRRIVDRHGGKIWVESQKGKGSTFYFILNKNKTS